MTKIYFSNNKEELEQFLNFVAEEILQDNMSLFLGAGSSIQYGAQDWSSLIDSVFSEYKKGSNIDRAQYAELNDINIKQEIANQISSITVDTQKTDTYFNYLLNFDFKSIWTTNYDQIIEKILEQKSKNYRPIYTYAHFQDICPAYLIQSNGAVRECA